MNALNKLIVATIPMVPKPIVRQFANRYIAGEELSEAVMVVKQLNAQHCMATIDVLGESITERHEAITATNAIIDGLNAIKSEKLDSNVSIKPTQIGLALDKHFALENLRRIMEVATPMGNFIRLDMEDSPYTDSTIWLYREIFKEHKNTGLVLQAYLRRTSADVSAMVNDGLKNFRLCKGIYIEPEEIAFKGREEIQQNYIKLLEEMFDAGAYVGIATHDDVLVDAAYEIIRKRNLQKNQYEFQMLLGVRPELRNKIVRDGHRVRIYVPFGKRWYQYSIRRFKENPQIAGYVFKALFSSSNGK